MSHSLKPASTHTHQSSNVAENPAVLARSPEVPIPNKAEAIRSKTSKGSAKMTGEEATRSANLEEASDDVQEESTPTPQIATGSSILSEHPLKQRWTYWYLNDQRDRSWEKRLKKVCTFSTVEQFWGLYLNIRPPSMLHNTCDYNVFKENIQPMWEVPENANGGRWLITIDKSRHHDLLDAVWLEVLLAVIGDQFGKYTDDICGIVVNIRSKGSKISIWTTNASNDESNLKIGEILKQKLINPEIDQKIPRPLFDMLRYEDHQEVQYKSSSSVRAKFTISSQE